MKIFPENPAPQNSKTRRIVVAGINCIIWMYGLFYLKWNVYEAHFLFMLDMQLYISFGYLRVLCAKEYDKGFFTNFAGRAALGFGVWVFCTGMIFVFSDISPIDKQTYLNLFNSSNSLIYGTMFLNYSGFFMHDFIFSGAYKTANPYRLAMIDFVSVHIIMFALVFTLNLLPHEREPRFFSTDTSTAFNLYNAVALLVARFVLELFLALKAHTMFIKMGKQPDREASVK